MSVVRRKPGQTPSQTTSQPQSTQPIDDELSNVEWIDMTSRTAFKVNPGDEVIFKPLEQPKAVKNGSAWVVEAYVYMWKDSTGKTVHQNETLTIYMQKVLAMRVQDAIAMYGLGNFIVHAKNLGRVGSTRYYNYEVKVGVIKR